MTRVARVHARVQPPRNFGYTLLFTALQLTLVAMSNPWPAPILRQRQNDLGWLALSPPEDELRVGATGSTREEAAASYASHRATWKALRDARSSDLVNERMDDQ